MSWSTDEAFSVYAGDSTTSQWEHLVSGAINSLYTIFEAGDNQTMNILDYAGHLGSANLSAPS